MGGEKFDSTHPEGYLFGENTDLNFLGTRPVAVGHEDFHRNQTSSSFYPLNRLPITVLDPVIVHSCQQSLQSDIKDNKKPKCQFLIIKGDLVHSSCGSCCCVYMFFRWIQMSLFLSHPVRSELDREIIWQAN